MRCGSRVIQSRRHLRTNPTMPKVSASRILQISLHETSLNMPATIKFYRTADLFGQFSNFADYPVRIGKRTWPTTEHYFQAMKFSSKHEQEKIRKANSPMIAARLGRDRRKKLRRDWETVKLRVMREAVLAKFTQHLDLQELLLSTGDAKIIEHTANDSFWGDGGDGNGRNMLGQILMEVRNKLRNDLETRK